MPLTSATEQPAVKYVNSRIGRADGNLKNPLCDNESVPQSVAFRRRFFVYRANKTSRVKVLKRATATANPQFKTLRTTTTFRHTKWHNYVERLVRWVWFTKNTTTDKDTTEQRAPFRKGCTTDREILFRQRGVRARR